MKLSKKQIKVALDILKKMRDKQRPVLANMSIQVINGETRLCLTNSYIMASWKLDNCDDLLGKCIKYEDLEQLYKLAVGKDGINKTWVKNMATEIPGYPNLDLLIFKNNLETPISKLVMDGNFLLQIQTLAGDFVNMTFMGDMKPIHCRRYDFFGVILPMRHYD